MNTRELQKLKEAHFAENAKRTGIPLRFYELPASVIEAYERKKREAKRKLLPTRGEVSLERRVRREVGD